MNNLETSSLGGREIFRAGSDVTAAEGERVRAGARPCACEGGRSRGDVI